MVRLLQGDRKIIITLIATSYDQGIDNSITECTTRRTLWVTGAEDHTRCHSCLLRTGERGYNKRDLSKIRQQKTGRCFLV